MVYPREEVTSLASTEFVPVFGDGVPIEVVFAVCSAPAFLKQMQSLVTGTTGSHQRVDKGLMLSVQVPDVRNLDEETSQIIVNLVQYSGTISAENLELNRLRTELLPLLMSGRLQVGDVAA